MRWTHYRILFGAIAGLVVGGCAHLADRPSPSYRLDQAVRSQPIVLMGEVHDNAEQHRLRAEALRALLETGARPALLMEQFDRERQDDLDRVLARPGITPDDVIAAATTGDPAMQGWSWPLYRPYLALAITYRLKVVAVNVSRADTRRIVQDGLGSQGFDASVPSDIRAPQSEAIVEGHCGMIDATLAAKMSDAQVARDQFMAREIEAYPEGAVLLAGNGHVRMDIGVPRWLPATTRAHSVAIGLLEADDPNTSAFDVAILTPAQARPDPCEAMRMPRSR